MRFYLGTHQPAWLARDLGVPLLVSHRRLAGRRTLPRASGRWALDSGGFTELSLHGRWRTDERSYVGALRRYATEIGRLEWCAPQDWMTESHVLARTGLSLRTHQQRTVTNYLRLRELAPELPIIPVLQGQSVTDYHRCADLYEQYDIDLAALPLLGVGSVCRRQHSTEVEHILRSLAMRGYRLHAFGAKVLGLRRYADAIASSDSAAWSYRGRFLPGCTPSHRSESNCLRFAMDWHDRLLATLNSRSTEHKKPSESAGSSGPCTRSARRPRQRAGVRPGQGRRARRATTAVPGNARSAGCPPRRRAERANATRTGDATGSVGERRSGESQVGLVVPA